jgi:uncharacterized membrane protein
MTAREKTATGLDEHVAGALTYALGWMTGALFLALEPSNRFVRFHAWQSVFTFGVLSLAWFIGLSIPVLGWIFSFIVIPLVSAVLWLWLMFSAYRGERYKLPLAGDMADQRR